MNKTLVQKSSQSTLLIKGKVRQGKKRGRTLGFPTANIQLRRLLPEGIYIALVTIQKVPYPALTFIGKAKTFNETTHQAESYILNFNSSIYNKWISIRLIQKIRDNMKFGSEKELIEQMKLDEREAQQFFNNYKFNKK